MLKMMKFDEKYAISNDMYLVQPMSLKKLFHYSSNYVHLKKFDRTNEIL